jgi:hypothetical protein
MNLVAVDTSSDPGRVERWPKFDHSELVAATLIQHPHYVDVVDGRWDENAASITMARTAVPELVTEIRRMRDLLAAYEESGIHEPLSA